MILLTASFIRLSPLRNGEQGVKIPLFLHQLVEAAGFGDTAVFQDEDAVITAQERGLQRVRHDDAGHTGQVEEVGRDLMRRFGVQCRRHLVRQQDGRFFQQAARDGDALLLTAVRPRPASAANTARAKTARFPR